MYLETCRLGFLAVGIILIIHLVLQISEEKETLRLRRLELKRTQSGRRRVRFSDVVHEEEADDNAPYEEEEADDYAGSAEEDGSTFVNDGVEVSVVPASCSTPPSAPPAPTAPPAPQSGKDRKGNQAEYYDDLKKELQHWMQQETKEWASADASSGSGGRPAPSKATSLDALKPAPVKKTASPLLKPDASRNVNLKISMMNEAARHPPTSDQAACHEEDANIVPGSSNEKNVMNSGDLGGGLAAWDAMGSSYGSALGGN
jgi:hypothetical protein